MLAMRTQWASEDGPRTTLKVILGGARGPVADRPRPTIADTAGAASDEADRWTNEGGSVDTKRPPRSVRCASELPTVPVYVYRRRDGSTFKTRQRMAEDALVDCPTTGQSVERVLQPITPRYHGTGFYSPTGEQAEEQRRSRGCTSGTGATGSEIRPRRPD